MTVHDEQETIRFYCLVKKRIWNYHSVVPGAYAYIAPVYGRMLRTNAVNRYVSLSRRRETRITA